VAFTDESRPENGKLDGTFHDNLISFSFWLLPRLEG
jgi:hypothetical protein